MCHAALFCQICLHAFDCNFIFLYKYSFIDNYPAVRSSSNNELLVLLELIAIAIFL